MTISHRKLAVYTVLTGSKEPLGNPLAALPHGAQTDLDLHFVCFTDNPALRSEVWEMRLLDRVSLPSEKLSRRPKALPHEYLADFDFSLYIDNIVSFKRLPQAADLKTDGAYLFKVFRHATRSHLQDEAEAITFIGYDQVDRLCAQLDHYERLMKVDTITPLSTCTIILREHRHPALVTVGVTWWEQILNFSKRDQMSFDFAVRWTGAQLEYLPGLKHDNELIHNPTNAQGQRVLANFDALKYAWRHRDDPAAQADPHQHWLNQPRNSAEGNLLGPASYAVQTEIFEYLCHRHRSSLGRHVSPRRQVAAGLQDLLAPRRGRGGRLLLVRVHYNAVTAYTDDELDGAEAVLIRYLQGTTGTRIDLTAAQLAPGRLACSTADGLFDIVVVIGVPGGMLAATHALVAPALNPASGLLFVLACEPLPLGEIASLETDITTRLRALCRSSVMPSWHDSLDEPLPNSVFSLSWVAP